MKGGITMPELQNAALLLEGGGLRGCFTSGVLDVFMEHNLYLSTVAAVSAGGLNATNYLSRQPGRNARLMLCYRHDPRYAGLLPILRSKNLFGLDFLLDTLAKTEGFDEKTFEESPQRMIAVATNVDTGQAEFLEKGICKDFKAALRASASLPMAALPVRVEGRRYLDGGCACAIPLEWAQQQGFEKIVVVATRHKGYRKALPTKKTVDTLCDFYGRWPNLLATLLVREARYNRLMDQIDALEAQGSIFVIRPAEPVEIARLEGDTGKLLALTNQGRRAAQQAMPALRAYLGG